MYPCEKCGLLRDGKSRFNNSGMAGHECLPALQTKIRRLEANLRMLCEATNRDPTAPTYTEQIITDTTARTAKTFSGRIRALEEQVEQLQRENRQLKRQAVEEFERLKSRAHD